MRGSVRRDSSLPSWDNGCSRGRLRPIRTFRCQGAFGRNKSLGRRAPASDKELDGDVNYASGRHRSRELSDCGNRFVDNGRRRALRMTYSNEISKAIRQRE